MNKPMRYRIEGHETENDRCVRCGADAGGLWYDVDMHRDSWHVRGNTCLGIEDRRDKNFGMWVGSWQRPW